MSRARAIAKSMGRLTQLSPEAHKVTCVSSLSFMCLGETLSQVE